MLQNISFPDVNPIYLAVTMSSAKTILGWSIVLIILYAFASFLLDLRLLKENNKNSFSKDSAASQSLIRSVKGAFNLIYFVLALFVLYSITKGNSAIMGNQDYAYSEIPRKEYKDEDKTVKERREQTKEVNVEQKSEEFLAKIAENQTNRSKTTPNPMESKSDDYDADYSVQLAAFETLDAAEEFWNSIRHQIKEVALIAFDDRIMSAPYKVLVGRFETMQDAEDFQDRHYPDGFVKDLKEMKLEIWEERSTGA